MAGFIKLTLTDGKYRLSVDPGRILRLEAHKRFTIVRLCNPSSVIYVRETADAIRTLAGRMIPVELPEKEIDKDVDYGLNREPRDKKRSGPDRLRQNGY